MKKAEGRWGKGPGETMGSTGVGQVRLGVSFLDILLENLRENSQCYTRLDPGSETPQLSAQPQWLPHLFFCTFEVTYAKFRTLLSCVFTSLLTPVHFWSKSKAVGNRILECKKHENNPGQDSLQEWWYKKLGPFSLKKTSIKLNKVGKTNHFRAPENDQRQTTNWEVLNLEKWLLHIKDHESVIFLLRGSTLPHALAWVTRTAS